VANLANTILGSGMLGLPYAFRGSGYIMGTLLLLTAGFFSSVGLHLLAVCAKKTQVTHPHIKPSFYSVAHAAVPSFTIVIDAAVALKCFGVSTGYLITVADCMVDLFKYALDDDSSVLVDRKLWVFVSLVAVTPLSFFRSLDALKFTSSLAVVFVIFLAAIIVLYSAGISSLDPCGEGGDVEVDDVKNDDDDGICKGSIKSFTDLQQILANMSIFIFAFTCHQNIFSVVGELSPSTMKRVDKVIALSISTALSIYMIVSWCGYFTYGDEVKGDILKNYPANRLISVMRVFISLLVVFSYPLQLDPSRRCIMTLIDQIRMKKESKGGVDTGSNNNTPREEEGECVSLTKGEESGIESAANVPIYYYSVTCSFLLGTFVLAYFIEDLSTILSFVGATGSTAVSYILPGLIYFKLHTRERKSEGKGLEHLEKSLEHVAMVGVGGDPELVEGDTSFWTKMSVLQVVLGLVIIPVALTEIILSIVKPSDD